MESAVCMKCRDVTLGIQKLDAANVCWMSPINQIQCFFSLAVFLGYFFLHKLWPHDSPPPNNPHPIKTAFR